MRKIPQLEKNYSENYQKNNPMCPQRHIALLGYFSYVKIFFTRGQFAWDKIIFKKYFQSHQRLNVENPNKIWFEQWLVGITDGDGSFSIIKQNKKIPLGSSEIELPKWNLTFKIGQSSYNLRLLYYIKKQLNVGSVYIEGNNAHYRIRDRKIIKEVIFPIFDKYPLLTTKYFNYIKFKEAYFILENNKLLNEEKKIKLETLLISKPSLNYISPAWNKITLPFKTADEIKIVMSKPWLVGFIEAEGSFFIVQKDKTRLVHSFGITQKLDKIVLESIKSILHISSKVQYRITNNNKYFKLETTNSRAIHNIINYFNNTMKGMKAIEYKIWARSLKDKNNFNKIIKVRDILRKLRLIRLNKNHIKIFDEVATPGATGAVAFKKIF